VNTKASFALRFGAVAALAIAAMSVPAAAQDTAAPSESLWNKICATDPATSKEMCVVNQEIKAETGQFIASAAIRQVTGEEKISLVVAVPPGLMIQPGIRVQVDQSKPYELKYGICFTNACYAELEINPKIVKAMKGGSKLIITAVTPQAKAASFPMSLVGFTKAYDGEGIAAGDAKARQDELDKALKARAEEARKKLIEQQQKEGGQTN
jgi:invasion protein IalB